MKRRTLVEISSKELAQILEAAYASEDTDVANYAHAAAVAELRGAAAAAATPEVKDKGTEVTESTENTENIVAPKLYKVVVHTIPKDKMIATIKLIRELNAATDLRGAEGVVDDCWSGREVTLADRVLLEKAQQWNLRLTQIGAGFFIQRA